MLLPADISCGMVQTTGSIARMSEMDFAHVL